MKKILQILGVIILLGVLIYVGLVIHTKYLIETGQLVNWQGTWYNTEELKKQLGDQYYDTEAKNTPEQVYTEFRQALLDNDIEKALSLMTEESRDFYNDIFANEEKLKAYSDLPSVEKIVKSDINSYGNFSSYFYYMNDLGENDVPFEISFEKNEYGYWQIDKI